MWDMEFLPSDKLKYQLSSSWVSSLLLNWNFSQLGLQLVDLSHRFKTSQLPQACEKTLHYKFLCFSLYVHAISSVFLKGFH